MLKVSIIGRGAWGRALGLAAGQADSQVTLMGRSRKEKTSLGSKVDLPPEMTLSSSFNSLSLSDIVIIAVPAQAVRSILEEIKSFLRKETLIVMASKGIEEGTGLLMSEVAEEVIPHIPLCVLSGPNFAHEVAEFLPTATTVGYREGVDTKKIIKALSHKTFRIYLNQDLIGVQIGGALKNVIAIGCGIIKSQGLGENARAAFITRGIADMSRLGLAKGAHRETFVGLSGLGDIILTCMGDSSRNLQFGELLGKAASPKEALDSIKATVEGFYTAKSVYELSQRLKVELPLCDMIYKILYEGIPVSHAMEALLLRPLGHE